MGSVFLLSFQTQPFCEKTVKLKTLIQRFYLKNYDGENWTSLAKIKGSGNSIFPRSYAFTDKQIETEISYYRLKQVDFDLSYEYSPIIYVLNSPTGFLASPIKPNPAENEIFFQIKTPVSGKVNYRFINETSRVAKSGTYNYGSGISDITLPLDELKSGFYLLELDFGNTAQKIFRKVVKL